MWEGVLSLLSLPVPSDDHRIVEISRLVARRRQLGDFMLVVSVRCVTGACWWVGGELYMLSSKSKHSLLCIALCMFL